MAIAQAKRTGRGFSALALNLDGFKKVDDALGHRAGDELLRLAGSQLRAALRDVDTLARVAGDEFIAILPGTTAEADIQIVARRMIAATQAPCEVQGNVLYVSASIGAATYPEHGNSEAKLLANADSALYRAKETGKVCCVVYDHAVYSVPKHDVSLEAARYDAIRNGEFLLHYQPIVDAATSEIVGFEALMRWMHPELGLLAPMKFIPIAESNGLINLLGAWVMKSPCTQIRHFQYLVGRPFYVSINVSPRQFRNSQFLSVVDEALSISGLRGDQLLLEITENILMSDPEHAGALLSQIAERHVKIAIDDFGTGHLSKICPIPTRMPRFAM